MLHIPHSRMRSECVCSHQKCMCVQVPLPEDEKEGLEAKPAKLAIGGDGGFQVDADKFAIDKTHSLVVLPEFLRVPIPCADLPEIVNQAINGIMVRFIHMCSAKIYSAPMFYNALMQYLACLEHASQKCFCPILCTMQRKQNLHTASDAAMRNPLEMTPACACSEECWCQCCGPGCAMGGGAQGQPLCREPSTAGRWPGQVGPGDPLGPCHVVLR